jgi:hypothetical protein
MSIPIADDVVWCARPSGRSGAPFPATGSGFARPLARSGPMAPVKGTKA